MPPQTEGFHVLKTIGSFLADGNYSEKIATSKEQTSTREEKIKTLMGRIGVAVDTVKALHKSTENWREGWKSMWSKEGWSGLWQIKNSNTELPQPLPPELGCWQRAPVVVHWVRSVPLLWRLGNL